ncbi:hypothetical protein ACJIZ3_007584 [Penstemon smallii]|uniref:Uncharacterized protein n=1 Tax=Penstemon smallii TaxID=265156 RepID=A0ABD3T9A4_9LAMI
MEEMSSIYNSFPASSLINNPEFLVVSTHVPIGREPSNVIAIFNTQPERSRLHGGVSLQPPTKSTRTEDQGAPGVLCFWEESEDFELQGCLFLQNFFTQLREITPKQAKIKASCNNPSCKICLVGLPQKVPSFESEIFGLSWRPQYTITLSLRPTKGTSHRQWRSGRMNLNGFPDTIVWTSGTFTPTTID